MNCDPNGETSRCECPVINAETHKAGRRSSRLIRHPMKTLRGLYPPLITPFHHDGEINETGLRAHVDFVIENGADGFCAGSSTGEFSNLTRAEWEQVIAICAEQNRGRVPMLAGTADMSTRGTIERCEVAERLGYDGFLIIPPWYQVHTMREIDAHFRAVRDATTKPIMIYNNPPVVGARLTLDLLVRLAEDDVIQYIKDADSDPYMLTRLRMHLGDKLGLFYGHDNNALGAFAFGATGWVSGSGNFDPARWSRIVHLCIDDGDFAAARALWDEIMPFVDLVTVGRNGERPDWIAVIKRGLELRGRSVGPVRRPMLALTPDVDARVRDVVGKMKFACPSLASV
jgi:4-hydroxy-tetrahydrodipicolinate synthase